MHSHFAESVLHVSEDQLLERSRWYGGNLLTFLANAAETRGDFTLIRSHMRKGFEPPLHVHSREEESYYILEGQVQFTVGDKIILAGPGDFVRSPRNIPHTFRLVSELATFNLLITPSGFEEMFIRFSRPAETLSLPPVPQSIPGKEFFDNMARTNAELGVTMLPNV